MEAHLIDAEAALGGKDFYDEVRCVVIYVCVLPCIYVHMPHI